MEKILNFELSRSVVTLSKELRKEYKLSDYESLKIALDVEKNEILKQTKDILTYSFNGDWESKYPPYLETIAAHFKDEE